MPGIQSTNLICTSEPLRGLCEKEATSIRKKKPAANWMHGGLLAWLRGEECARFVGMERREVEVRLWGVAYQRAGGVDTCVADGGVIEPFGLGEPEEPVAGDVHG